jgi:hypothetical protein
MRTVPGWPRPSVRRSASATGVSWERCRMVPTPTSSASRSSA